MSDLPKQDRPTPLGIYDRPRTESITGIEIIAIALTALWLLAAAIFFLILPTAGTRDMLSLAMVAMAVLLPVAMIWVAATAARSSRMMREESLRLQAAIDAMRHAYIAQQQGGQPTEPSVAKKLEEIAEATRNTENVLATFSTRREPENEPATEAPMPLTAPVEAEQPALELGSPAEDFAPPPEHGDFIRALNFPETAEDEEGFAALRRAMRDRPSAQLIQAAQDVLTLLSQDGIYMDDLQPDRARPDLWRAFAAGARGRTIASLGGVHEKSALALAAGRMKQDPIFRDAAHHFLRLFDKTFADFAPNASDAEISALSDTRTALAFMLLGRVAGTFD